MSDIESLYDDKRKYTNLRDKVINTMSQLKKAIDKINLVDDNVVYAYSINESSADFGKLKTIKNEIQSIYDNLDDNVLPSIKRKINQFENDIEAAEATATEGE